ncbi:hypothetical protein ADUPG1_001778, partial [Aduncisulcus paluster]
HLRAHNLLILLTHSDLYPMLLLCKLVSFPINLSTSTARDDNEDISGAGPTVRNNPDTNKQHGASPTQLPIL